MQSRIELNPEYALLEVTLEPGEKVVAESGAMVGMDSHLKLTSQSRGGILKGLARKMLGGESFFQSTFEAESAPGRVLLAPGAPGDIREIELPAGRSLMLQSSAYLASTPDVTLDTKWGGAKGFFSGAGLFLLKATGPGRIWFNSFGAMATQAVAGQFVVDTGHIVGFEETLNYSISKVGGLKGLLFSGEGLVARFAGTGTVYVQTRNPASFAAFLHPFRPVKNE
ncbi:MAG: TIGR00266 family protein [Deltaproteobacteria bacterium]|nr:TIGR00266 family protein [Deltaproteobacteria bacterium]